MYLTSINNFRAIAIILIVMGHSFSFAGMTFQTWPEKFVGNLISGATTLFVFISGFLFYHVFYARYDYKTFLTGKLKNVAAPYLILSVLPIIWSMTSGEPQKAFFNPAGPGVVDTWIVPYVKYVLTGGFATAYWYIPFIMLVFLMAPAHIAFIRLSTARQIAITAALVLVAALVQRSHGNLNPVQHLIAFTPAYLFGITVAMNKEVVWARLAGKEWHLALCVAFFDVAEIATGHFSNYHKAPFAWGGLDLMLFQKLFMCLLLLQLLHRFEGRSSKTLSLVASTSFAIFFIHPGLLKLIHTVRDANGIRFDASWPVLLLATTGILAASILIAIGVNILLGKKSRYVIGYAGKAPGLIHARSGLRPA
ncbi:acyltransferase family protein [Rhodobium gokarnense]|uniref:Peptidoglycan/LPS O-acetylase OafA/YrhL n=1 Tax=Rhodobium gokarnense TaxID=364296 RepID=A0ABT3HD38_9HYPH|nr:acyltransferase [Rhodobium gokarnense]MCW2308290.1 peptidoglycan/LPS O-acetylase OafA/YrhL [Rhodobium gokarnense]